MYKIYQINNKKREQRTNGHKHLRNVLQIVQDEGLQEIIERRKRELRSLTGKLKILMYLLTTSKFRAIDDIILYNLEEFHIPV